MGVSIVTDFLLLAPRRGRVAYHRLPRGSGIRATHPTPFDAIAHAGERTRGRATASSMTDVVVSTRATTRSARSSLRSRIRSIFWVRSRDTSSNRLVTPEVIRSALCVKSADTCSARSRHIVRKHLGARRDRLGSLREIRRQILCARRDRLCALAHIAGDILTILNVALASLKTGCARWRSWRSWLRTMKQGRPTRPGAPG